MKSNSLSIGIFVVGGLALFGIGLFVIGDRHQAFARHAEYYSEFANLAGLTNRAYDGIGEQHRHAPCVGGGIKLRTAGEKTIRQMIAQEEIGRRLGFQRSDRRNQVGGHNGFIIHPSHPLSSPKLVRYRWFEEGGITPSAE